ncbi:N-acetylneuraminate synthase family protein [Roseburia faecis]|uniref:N-acetylneuraminate synthase family protein n=1 Tax=Roseburia faecis TaxID=301302 RepID=UPI003F99D6EC
MSFKLGNRLIGNNQRPYFIADIAANHDGDINRAYKLIELAKESGADCAKFQNFKAATIVSKNGFDTMKGQLSHQKSWKKSVYEVYDEASISDYWTPLLKEKCDEVGIEYMTSPYDYASVDLADKYSDAFKIGSGDITWIDIIDYIAQKDKPVLLATGASTMADVDRAVKTLQKKTENIVLMQCNTNYTASLENYKYINLNVLNTFRNKYPDVILGLSDHTFGHATVLGAIALGARVIEKHFTDDNNRIGPDHKFSMNPKSWKEMVEEADKLYDALGDGIKKIEDNEADTAIVQRRSLYFRNDMKKGQVVTTNDLFPLRPSKEGTVLPYEMDKIIGKRVSRDIAADTEVHWEDITDVNR